jgi:hypothetical protein
MYGFLKTTKKWITVIVKCYFSFPVLQIKESIVGEIRREIVSGLLAAVSSSKVSNPKQDSH